MDRLFVYGTLAPGRPNEHVLADLEGVWQPASLRGRLDQKGWGAEMGYPGLHLDDQGDEIAGFVFSSSELAGQWTMLDAFEGEEYERCLSKVRLEDGTSLDAYVYTLKS